jgi:uncharacterized protein
MKKSFTIIIALIAISQAVFGQSDSTAKNLESQLRQYWFVMLTTGNNRTQDSVTTAKIQQGHIANIIRLYNEGKLKVAGPFGDEGKWKGIFIFDCKDLAEVENLLKTDPAVSSGRLAYEILPWWTTATGSFVPGKPTKGN